MFKTREYFEFVEQIKKEIQHMTEKWKAEVNYQPASLSDEEPEDILIVSFPTKSGVGIQRFHLEDMYQDILERKISFIDLMGQASEILKTCREIVDIEQLENINDYEKIRNHLIIRPLNYERKADRLKSGVYYRIDDVALTLYISIGNLQNGYVSCMAGDDLLTIWEKKKEEVMETAIRNTYCLYPPRLADISSACWSSEMNLKSFMHSKPDIDRIGGIEGTFVTTTNQVNGAVSIFLPGVAKRLGDLIGDDYYIGFISTEMVVVHACNVMPAEAIQEALQYQNRLFTEEEFLSNKVYFYSRNRDQIDVIA
ncbi:MAG: DUF5688 family protein [Hungatella sp.]|jgi:hypothetical protein|nr:DUF5688 family protein [Hungatella sp.]